MASVGYLPQSNSVNRAVLEENRSIKTVSETFLRHFVRNVNYLTWPDTPCLDLVTRGISGKSRRATELTIQRWWL